MSASATTKPKYLQPVITGRQNWFNLPLTSVEHETWVTGWFGDEKQQTKSNEMRTSGRTDLRYGLESLRKALEGVRGAACGTVVAWQDCPGSLLDM